MHQLPSQDLNTVLCILLFLSQDGGSCITGSSTSLDSISLVCSHFLSSSTSLQVTTSSTTFCPDCGVVEDSLQLEGDIAFQTGCRNQTCQSDLAVDLFLQDQEHGPFVIGSSNLLKLTFIASNQDGEPAYKPLVRLRLPDSLALTKIPPECSFLDGVSMEDKQLQCRLYSPLLPGAPQRKTVELDASGLYGGIQRLNFTVELSSDSKDTNTADNYKVLLQVNISFLAFVFKSSAFSPALFMFL